MIYNNFIKINSHQIRSVKLKKILFSTWLLTFFMNSAVAGDAFFTPEDLADTYSTSCKYVPKYNNYKLLEPCNFQIPLAAGSENYGNFYLDEDFHKKVNHLFHELGVNKVDDLFDFDNDYNVSPSDVFFKSVFLLTVPVKSSSQKNKFYSVLYSPKNGKMMIAEQNGVKNNYQVHSRFVGDTSDLTLRKALLYSDHFTNNGMLKGNHGSTKELGFNPTLKKQLNLN